MGRTRIYVAGASAEIERAEQAMRWITSDPRMELSMDWAHAIRAQGQANPWGPELQRLTVSNEIITAVRGADVLWLLLPEVPTAGAWVELGAAAAFSSVGAGPPKKFVSSGATEDRYRSIFTALCRDHFDFDQDAFVALRMYAA